MTTAVDYIKRYMVLLDIKNTTNRRNWGPWRCKVRKNNFVSHTARNQQEEVDHKEQQNKY